METNKIMENEEVTEAIETAAEEVVTKGSKSKFKTAAVGGLTVLVGGLVVQYIVIPTVVKIRKKKRNSDTVNNGFDVISGGTSEDFIEENGSSRF